MKKPRNWIATRVKRQLTIVVSSLFILQSAFAFEGRIRVVLTHGDETMPLLYTVGTNLLRIEVTVTNRPNPVDIVDRHSGQLTLLFPHNRGFVRLKNGAAAVPPAGGGGILSPGFGRESLPNVGIRNDFPPVAPPGPGVAGASGTPAATIPSIPPPPAGLPPGIGPQPSSAPGAFAIPSAGGFPAFSTPPMEQVELKATGEKTNILGLACARYELKQRGETMEIWATDKLFPFQPYVQNQPHRFGPRMIEEQWPGLLTAKKLFPLRATLRFGNGAERFRFEVKSITPEKIKDPNGKLFQPPTDYHEIEPLPF